MKEHLDHLGKDDLLERVIALDAECDRWYKQLNHAKITLAKISEQDHREMERLREVIVGLTDMASGTAHPAVLAELAGTQKERNLWKTRAEFSEKVCELLQRHWLSDELTVDAITLSAWKEWKAERRKEQE